MSIKSTEFREQKWTFNYMFVLLGKMHSAAHSNQIAMELLPKTNKLNEFRTRFLHFGRFYIFSSEAREFLAISIFHKKVDKRFIILNI